MFADDTKVYRELSNIAKDSEALQLDVDQRLSWASKWQLRFNPDKCVVLRITHKRDFSLPTYSLGTSLKSVKHVKDLGIMVSSDLSWSEQVNVTVNKANKLFGLVHRTVGSMIFLNSLSAIQPALAIRISFILNQPSAIRINILFLSESYGTGTIYQVLLLRLGAWVVLRMR